MTRSGLRSRWTALGDDRSSSWTPPHAFLSLSSVPAARVAARFGLQTPWCRCAYCQPASATASATACVSHQYHDKQIEYQRHHHFLCCSSPCILVQSMLLGVADHGLESKTLPVSESGKPTGDWSQGYRNPIVGPRYPPNLEHNSVRSNTSIGESSAQLSTNLAVATPNTPSRQQQNRPALGPHGRRTLPSKCRSAGVVDTPWARSPLPPPPTTPLHLPRPPPPLFTSPLDLHFPSSTFHLPFPLHLTPSCPLRFPSSPLARLLLVIVLLQSLGTKASRSS